jgi:Protein of unknown function (DUF3074)
LSYSIIVSIPVDVSDDAELAKLEEKGVRARYASVERLQERDGGKVHWQMATSSTPGGMIPSFIAEMSIDGQISAVSYLCRSFALHVVISSPHAGCPSLHQVAPQYSLQTCKTG